MRPVTLIYCLHDDLVLLGEKKRGFGKGKLNGYGGKVQEGEDFFSAAIRELFEEAKIHALKEDLEKIAEIDFFFSDVPVEKDWNQTVHVYSLKKWDGKPQETEEMKPEWHKRNAMPMERMWIDDPYWLPMVLEGKKIQASFTFGKQGESIIDYKIKIIDAF